VKFVKTGSIAVVRKLKRNRNKVIQADKSVHWYCKGCSRGVAKLLDTLHSIAVRQDKIDEKLEKLGKTVDKSVSDVNSKIEKAITEVNNELDKKISAVDSKFSALRKEISDFQSNATVQLCGAKSEIEKVQKAVLDVENKAVTLVKETDTKIETLVEAKLLDEVVKKVDSVVSDKVKVVVDNKVKYVSEEVDEKLEIEKRRCNIVVFGVKEQDILVLDKLSMAKSPDQEVVEEIIITGLQVDATRHIDDVSRIGKFIVGKCRPVRVVLKSFEAKVEIMKRVKLFKEHEEYKEIYITPDLTRKQQDSDKQLRAELKKLKEQGETSAKIKKGKIVKNLQNGKMEILYQLSQN